MTKIIKLWFEINKIEANSKQTEITRRILKTMSCFFEKINKTNKPLAKTNKRWRENTQINKTRNEKQIIAIDTKEIQKLIKTFLKKVTTQNRKMEIKWIISLIDSTYQSKMRIREEM